jgi:hypothetical protein
MLVKLTPDVDFINILHAQFSYKILAPKNSTQSTAYVQNFGNKNSLLYEKCARKTLMKLTAGLFVLPSERFLPEWYDPHSSPRH